MINIGTLELADAYVGSTPIEKAYIGSTLVWEKNSLPYDAQVEWIATDGEAYIDTGLKPTNATRFEIIMDIPTLSQSVWMWGARNGYASGQCAVLWDKDNGRWDWRFGNKTLITTSTQSANRYLFDNHTSGSARQLYIKYNETTLSLVAANNSFTCNYNFFIFAMNVNGTASMGMTPSGITCVSAKFWSGTTLVRDYIPVRKDGVGYLYDNVSGEFYGNASSVGVFTYGNDVT